MKSNKARNIFGDDRRAKTAAVARTRQRDSKQMSREMNQVRRGSYLVD